MNLMKRLVWLLLIAILSPAFAAEHPVGLFYMTSDPKSIRDFFAHSSQIDLLVPAWYQVDENGLVTGAPEPAVLAQAQSEKLSSAVDQLDGPGANERGVDSRM
jgi:hypothetical protein